MENPASNLISMTRTEPALNMARFYRLWLEPTLFGEVTVTRNWGRIGTWGQVKGETFAEPVEASVALERLAHKKIRRGYR